MGVDQKVRKTRGMTVGTQKITCLPLKRKVFLPWSWGGRAGNFDQPFYGSLWPPTLCDRRPWTSGQVGAKRPVSARQDAMAVWPRVSRQSCRCSGMAEGENTFLFCPHSGSFEATQLWSELFLSAGPVAALDTHPEEQAREGAGRTLGTRLRLRLRTGALIDLCIEMVLKDALHIHRSSGLQPLFGKLVACEENCIDLVGRCAGDVGWCPIHLTAIFCSPRFLWLGNFLFLSSNTCLMPVYVLTCVAVRTR